MSRPATRSGDRQIDGTGSAQLRKRIAQRGVARKNDATVIAGHLHTRYAACGMDQDQEPGEVAVQRERSDNWNR
jgi:hypothetical protein